MEATGVYPPAAVVKIGDTVPDIEEGRNAGVWTVGVSHTGSAVGCTADEFATLPDRERFERVAAATRALLAAGAHDVIPSAAEAPALVDRLNERWPRRSAVTPEDGRDFRRRPDRLAAACTRSRWIRGPTASAWSG